MIILIVSCNIFASLAVAKDTDSVVFIGKYQKVESSTGEHCYGFSVDIWKQNNQPFGLFHYHIGLCGDPPCGVLQAVSYDAKSGDLSFSVETRVSKFQFSGKLTRELLSGSLQESLVGQTSWTKDTVELPRDQEPATEEFYGKTHSLSERHARYGSNERCVGLAEYKKPSK